MEENGKQQPKGIYKRYDKRRFIPTSFIRWLITVLINSLGTSYTLLTVIKNDFQKMQFALFELCFFSIFNYRLKTILEVLRAVRWAKLSISPSNTSSQNGVET